MARRRVQPPVQDATQGRRARAKDAESEDDASKADSQQILALRPLLKKPKGGDKEVEHFREKVTADQEQLRALLEQRMHQAEEEEARRRYEIAATIMEALETPNQAIQGQTPTLGGTKIASNTAYASVSDVLKASEGLIVEYQRLDNIIKGLRDERTESVADTWKQNLDETEKQLKMGARVALRNVKKVLGADTEGEELAPVDEDGDEKMEGVVGEAETETELNYELHRSLRYAERGVKRMVKGLPNDEVA
ncbi:uncharacterized protein K460DRAFT_395090 [Cucurbitaria berberidis CBS 394.84]|uniref:Uncharacterized protein n=1 Tax=Cucurbitaria berberidis CBS 394.84 TaxID=1168544 RepID=A0A9P4GHJ1_9PLEO|nr:uncharacterized protein K460DRAFT_395090 [Cucurbitaria berberidis CBS 394.84]KAF1845427.1 hypothetical protein K460DRAFT_395090 [Cucurbitaria berberidis CBS 394.84]